MGSPRLDQVRKAGRRGVQGLVEVDGRVGERDGLSGRVHLAFVQRLD
jgi:hypothetical protein